MQQLKFIILQQFNHQHKNIQDLCTVLSVCQLTPVLRVTIAKKDITFPDGRLLAVERNCCANRCAADFLYGLSTSIPPK